MWQTWILDYREVTYKGFFISTWKEVYILVSTALQIYYLFCNTNFGLDLHEGCDKWEEDEIRCRAINGQQCFQILSYDRYLLRIKNIEICVYSLSPKLIRHGLTFEFFKHLPFSVISTSLTRQNYFFFCSNIKLHPQIFNRTNTDFSKNGIFNCFWRMTVTVNKWLISLVTWLRQVLIQFETTSI